LDELWPELKKKVPRVKLQIVGRAAGKALAEYRDMPDLTIHEDVSDVIPHFRNIDVLLYAPDYGSGMKVKILEAFALGVAVVTNDEGVEGLPARDGVHAGICNANRGLIDRAAALLLSSDQRHKQSSAARRLVETHCSPKAVVDAFESRYSAMLTPAGTLS
jgi:glycosyltransferase involved in cell wall biosynthesis